MEKALLKIIFWHKIFVALFKTFGMQIGDMVKFFEVFQKSEILKNVVSI